MNQNERWRVYYAKNRAKRIAQMRIYQQMNRERILAHRRARSYGLSAAQIKTVLSRKTCDICGNEWDKRGPCIDHDHQTGRVRGVLCDRCNKGIGLLGDSAAITMRAAAYLKNPPGLLEQSDKSCHEMAQMVNKTRSQGDIPATP